MVLIIYQLIYITLFDIFKSSVQYSHQLSLSQQAG